MKILRRSHFSVTLLFNSILAYALIVFCLNVFRDWTIISSHHNAFFNESMNALKLNNNSQSNRDINPLSRHKNSLRKPNNHIHRSHAYIGYPSKSKSRCRIINWKLYETYNNHDLNRLFPSLSSFYDMKEYWSKDSIRGGLLGNQFPNTRSPTANIIPVKCVIPKDQNWFKHCSRISLINDSKLHPSDQLKLPPINVTKEGYSLLNESFLRDVARRSALSNGQFLRYNKTAVNFTMLSTGDTSHGQYFIYKVQYRKFYTSMFEFIASLCYYYFESISPICFRLSKEKLNLAMLRPQYLIEIQS